MAFDANVVIIKEKYNDDLINLVYKATNFILNSFNIKVETNVNQTEYRKNTSSTDINKYIRVRNNDFEAQDEKAFKLIKVGTERYETFEQFASVKYAFFSISSMGEYTVIWHNFHSLIGRMFKEFQDFPDLLAKSISYVKDTELIYMKATTRSRNDDVFKLYFKGTARNEDSQKAALSRAKEIYGLDINEVMENIDKNMAIYYAPYDFVAVKTQIKIQKEKHKALLEAKFKIEDKENKEEMMEKFKKENIAIMASLQQQLTYVEGVMKMEPEGTILFMKMTDKGPMNNKLPTNETNFGRSVQPPS